MRARPPDVPDVVEDADTFEGNARLKAVALAAATGEAALADDSGLEVDALDGAPGRALGTLRGRARDRCRQRRAAAGRARPASGPTDAIAARRARFRCVLVLRWPDGRELVAEGAVEGRIALVPRGDGGFGYDPVFVPDEGDGRTFADDRPPRSRRSRTVALATWSAASPTGHEPWPASCLPAV